VMDRYGGMKNEYRGELSAALALLFRR